MITAGIDLGSLYTKVVILKAEESQYHILSTVLRRSGAVYKRASGEALEEALKLAGLQSGDVNYIVSTGYGRYQSPFGNTQINELSCHARGIRFFCRDVYTLVDIGGQDSRVISLSEEGRVRDFMMNDKCAAGTGRFLEVMADALEIDLSQMGELASLSKQNVPIASTCTVFAESEVISLLSEGYDRIDIAAGIYRAIANRMMGFIMQVGLKEKVAMSGGVAKSVGMIKALEDRIGTKVFSPEETQLVGALGAALLAAERAKKG